MRLLLYGLMTAIAFLIMLCFATASYGMDALPGAAIGSIIGPVGGNEKPADKVVSNKYTLYKNCIRGACIYTVDKHLNKSIQNCMYGGGGVACVTKFQEAVR